MAGVQARIPDLTHEHANLIAEQPHMMLTNEVLDQIKLAHKDMRESLITFMVKLIDPGANCSRIVSEIHAA